MARGGEFCVWFEHKMRKDAVLHLRLAEFDQVLVSGARVKATDVEVGLA